MLNKELETITKRYNGIMVQIGYEHSTIGTDSSEHTEGWGVKEMVKECEYYLSTYFEVGHGNEEMRRDGDYSKKKWLSDTGKLKRFIERYKDFVEEEKTIKLHEWMATTEWYDGEFIMNGYCFWNEYSFTHAKTKMSESSFEVYGDVLNATYLGKDKDGDIMFEIKHLSTDDAVKKARAFLQAQCGLISATKYDEYFVRID